MHFTTNNEVATFLAELDIQAEELDDYSSDSPPPIDTLKERAVARALERHETLTTLAKSLGYGEMTFARNLVATATAEELPLLQTLLECWLQEAPLEPVEEHRKLVNALPSKVASNTTLRWLLSLEDKSTFKDLVEFCDWWRALLLNLEREIPGVSKKSGPSRTLRILRTFARQDPDLFDSEDDEVHQELAKEGFAKGLPQLDKQSFEKLPKSGRRWILRERGFARSALAAEFYSEIWSDPRAHPDTWEAIQHAKWLNDVMPDALSQLASRSFGEFEVTSLLSQDDLETYASSMLQSLASNAATDEEQTPLSLPRPLSSIQNRRLRNALGFFSKKLDRRLAFVTSLRNANIRQLADDVSLSDWFLAVRSSRSTPALKRVANLILSDPDQRMRFLREIPETSTSSNCLKLFTDAYLGAADQNMISRLFSMRPDQLRLITKENLGQALFREFIQQQGVTQNGFTSLASFARSPVLRDLFTSNEQWKEEWRGTVADAASGSHFRYGKPLRIRFLEQALHYSPTLIKTRFGWTLSLDDYESLQHQLLTSKPASWHKRLLRFVDENGRRCWERSFRSGKCRKELKRLIAWQRPKLLKRLAELRADESLYDESVEKQLQQVLEGKLSHRKLRVSQAQLRYFIPWALDMWEDKPTVATAYELALAFSISSAPFFLALCTERWKSGPKGREGRLFDHFYTTHTIPKKSGGTRTITVPDDRLKRLQRKILRNGFDELFVHPSAHGFKRGRSILSNAKVHVGQPCVVNVDIKSFFPNTRFKHVLKACSLLLDGELSDGARHVVADLCCYDGGLATGAPTSPAIANLVLRAADTAIAKAAKANGINYSRYADDLTFSGSSNALQILPFVEKVLGQLGYELDPKKTNIFRRGRRQIVTGLVVNEKPNLPRRVRRRLRAAVHREINGDGAQWNGHPMSRNELVGRLAMLQLVQPAEAKALKTKLVGQGAT